MRLSIAPLVVLATSLPLALGHGQVHSVITSSGTYKAADAYAAADPTSPLRKLNTYGFVEDFTGPDLTCGPGGNVPVPNLAEVTAGSKVTFDWGGWSSDHPGPVMTYIAKCPNGCASFKGETGAVWVKIDQDQYNPTRTGIPWGEDIIRLKGSQYSVTVPAELENGEYILRHEILGLHVAGQLNGAQFYPNCLQIKVTNGGSLALPAGIPLPGSYDPHDPGILVELWRITPQNSNYTAPGGPVLLRGGTGDWGNEAYGVDGTGGGVTSAPPAQTTVGTSSPSGPTQGTGSGVLVEKYGQCGGQSYTGSTACVAGSTCQKLNDFYSQCL